MKSRDGFVFIIVFLFQGSMLTAFRNWMVGDLGTVITSALIAGICVLILLYLPDDLERETGEADQANELAE